jgi:hypothetical protein
MKKKLLPLAMLAGLAGAAGTAQAVHVNSDGLGEVLLYPFYTVEGGQDTYFSVVNTTNTVKAVKVRLLEAMNSAEVIDFNLYLSPHDHWAAVITADPDGAGAILKTADTSCTVPAIPAAGVQLRNLLFSNGSGTQNQNADGGPSGLERTREGYIEVIEMGTLDDNEAEAFGAEAAATHGANGVPANCALLVAAWQEQPLFSGNVVGQWSNPNRNLAAFSEELTGGLYGYGVLINPVEGTNATYSAVALDDFAALNIHARPGDTAPNLGQAFPEADIIEGNQVFNLSFLFSDESGLDAVSAVLMHDAIVNDYVLEPSISAGTDWVVTMPTKRDYVNGQATATLPFLNIWNTATGTACEEVQIEYWNREEQQPGTPPVEGGVDFSPSPIPEEAQVVGFALCSEANVISFLSDDVVIEEGEIVSGYVSALNPSSRTQYGFRLAEDFYNGWARLTMATDNIGNERVLTDDNGVELYGLPVIGFAVQKYTNASLAGVGGEGAFYSGLIDHKATRLIVTD